MNGSPFRPEEIRRREQIATLRKGLPYKDPALGERMFAAMRKAGLPD